MNRRDFLLLGSIAAGLPACGGGGGGTASSTAPGTPNILQIVIDDLNDWVGFLGGHPQVRTPHLDALASRSTIFAHAYATAPLCSPSRASVLSGLSVQSTGVFDNTRTFEMVNPGKRTFDRMLKAAGYDIARFGKVDHFISEGSEPQPLPPTIPASNTLCPYQFDSGAFDWAPMPEADELFPDYQYAQRGIHFLQSRAGHQPFCLSVGFVRTHVAWYLPKRFFDMYPLDSIALPDVPTNDLRDLGPIAHSIALTPNFFECIAAQGLWANAVRAYLASISWVDTQVGRLLAALDASRHADTTMVVLWSDQGFHLGEKYHWLKETLWERALRVPCLIRMPGQTASVRQSQCVSLRDLAPTVLAACNVASDYPMDGVSLLPLLDDPATPWDRPALSTLGGVHNTIRTNRWRYIRYDTGEQELYDEMADPGEIVNLAGLPSSVEVMARLAALMPPRQWGPGGT